MKAALKKQTEFKAKAKAKRQDMARRSAAIDKDIDEQQVLIAKLQGENWRKPRRERWTKRW